MVRAKFQIKKRGQWSSKRELKEYHMYTGYTRYVDFKKLDFIVSSLKEFSHPKSKGLDLGCGRGNIAIPLSLFFMIIGIDISHEDIRRADSKKFLADNPIFLCGDAEHLCILEKETFDFVICSEVLEHLKNPETALNSINRVLKKNGILIVTVPNGYGPYCLIYDHLKIHTGHLQFFSLNKIRWLLAKTGFEVLDVRHSDFLSFLPFLVRFKMICHYDCKLADKLPHFFVSGFYLLCKKVKNLLYSVNSI